VLLQQAYGEYAIVVHKCLTGSIHFTGVDLPLKATRAREAARSLCFWRFVYSEFIVHNFETFHFFLFSRIEKVLKGHRFEAMEDIKRNSSKTQLDIPKEEFAKRFQQWQKLWAKCVATEGNCVKDN
jgi:hypothetical protein